MHWRAVKEMRFELENNGYFVNAVYEKFILVTDLNDEYETQYRVYGNRCEKCGKLMLEASAQSLHLFDLNGLTAICSVRNCNYVEEEMYDGENQDILDEGMKDELTYCLEDRIDLVVGNTYKIDGRECVLIRKINIPYSLCKVQYKDDHSCETIPTPEIRERIDME